MNFDRITAYDLEQDVHRITLYSSVAREHQHVGLKPRLYLHIDMNCFYAQVEQRAWNLYGFPVAMGGWRKPDGTPRGIVATASYEARQLGIKTAMSAFEVHQICHYLIVMQIDYDKYKGIGRRRYRRLQRHHILTIADACKRGPAVFEQLFGAMQGRLFYEMVTGQDRARVLDNADHVPDEVSYMHTFSDWTDKIEQVRAELLKAIQQVCYRMRGYRRKARRFGCYLRYQNAEWQGASFAFTTPGYTNLDEYVMNACILVAMELLRRAQRDGHTFRGVGLHTIEMAPGDQLEIFFQEDERLGRLYRSVDTINNIYDKQAIVKGATRDGVPGKTHFVNRS